ncbi:WD40-repeat-containing domain protein, partial [Cerioporus squamosus]
HDASVTAAAASPDGRYVATIAVDDTIIIWSGMPFSQTVLVEIRRSTVESSLINALAFSDTGEFLAVAQSDNVLIWLVADGALVNSIPSHTKPVTAACASHCERYVATASEDTTVRLWSVRDGSLVWTFIDHDAAVTHVVFSADGRTLVSADEEGRVCV